MEELVEVNEDEKEKIIEAFEYVYPKVMTSEENEDKYLRGCSHECRVHPRNRYVEEHNLSQAEVRERLAVIGETLDGAPA